MRVCSLDQIVATPEVFAVSGDLFMRMQVKIIVIVVVIV